MKSSEVVLMEKMTTWIEEIFTDELLPLLEARAVMKRLVDVLKSESQNQDIDTRDLEDTLRYSYVSSMVLAIGRQTDKDTRTLSLLNLIQTLQKNTNYFTKSWFIKQYQGLEKDQTSLALKAGMATKDWESALGQQDEELSDTFLQADIDQLLQVTENIRIYRDQHIAHKDLNRDQGLGLRLTFADLDKSIDFLESLTRKYYLLITQAGLTDSLLDLNYDWERLLKS